MRNVIVTLDYGSNFIVPMDVAEKICRVLDGHVQYAIDYNGPDGTTIYHALPEPYETNLRFLPNDVRVMDADEYADYKDMEALTGD